MKIVQLHAENFKRLGVVEITPEGNLITVGGKNGHGKSSVLDAIYVALKGRAVAPPRPIRKGEEKCVIRLDLGDLVITRGFHEKAGNTYTDTIKVEDAEGRRYGKPQEVLNALLGEVGFDPFEFVNLKPKDQVARLLEMVPLTVDLDELREADESDYLNRRDVNRDVSRLEAQLAGIPKEEVPADLPDRSALTEQLGNAANTNAALQREMDRRDQEAARARAMIDKADEEADHAAALRKQADELDASAADRRKSAEAIEKELAGLDPVGEFVDTDDLRAKLREAEEVSAVVDRQNRRAAIAKELEEARAKSQAFTDAMEARAKQRNAALAEADMPVEGLAIEIDEKGEPTLTWEGLPFDPDQISTAAQLRVSTAIGMATNPQLRVLRIMDGSLLDEDSMRMLAEMAEAEDFQLWVEVVGDGGVGIVMENGLIRGSAEAADAAETEPAEETDQDAPAEKAAGKSDLFDGDAE